MKLYTEFQMRKAFNCGRLYLGREGDTNYEQLIEKLTPIELPSDEEIENKMHSTEKYHIMKDFYCDGFKDGAKYVINKIQGGNK